MPKDNVKRPELEKYKDTMLADMGLSSLDELSPSERKRWLKAVAPSSSVKKKLKEMGYSLTGFNNKRSLGRVDELFYFYKMSKIIGIAQ